MTLKTTPQYLRSTALFAVSLYSTMLIAGDIQTENRSELRVQQSSVTKTQTMLTDKARAAVWGLDLQEWQRYSTLMQGIRGSISPKTLSPIEVLGIHARNPAERRRYAERWVMMMREDAERILAFQQAYDEAQQRLFPQQRVIDTQKLAALRSVDQHKNRPDLAKSDRLLFFTRMDCVACDAVLKQLLKMLPNIAGIDLYLLDIAEGDEDRIREWAQKSVIKPQWVQVRRVTLNRDAGALGRLAATDPSISSQVPLVLRRREGTLYQIPVSRLSKIGAALPSADP